jgi:hypothetical protein
MDRASRAHSRSLSARFFSSAASPPSVAVIRGPSPVACLFSRKVIYDIAGEAYEEVRGPRI